MAKHERDVLKVIFLITEEMVSCRGKVFQILTISSSGRDGRRYHCGVASKDSRDGD